MRGEVLDAAREQADRGLAGSMEGHAAMDMPVTGEGSFWSRLFSPRGFTAVSNYFVMDWAAALRITGIFYLAMVAAGYVIELVFAPLGLVPDSRSASVTEAHLSWNHTTWLNIVFLALAAALVTRFVRTGGWQMLSMMGGSPDDPDADSHGEAHHDQHSG